MAPNEILAPVAVQVRRSQTTRTALFRVQWAEAAAFTDALTGLFNRRFLDQDLERRVRRARSGNTGFVLAVFDLDEFKRINDTWGHGVGDVVLRAVAGCLRAGIRESDLACRFGGEEFVIVYPATRLADALAEVDGAAVGCGAWLPAAEPRSGHHQRGRGGVESGGRRTGFVQPR